MLPQCKHVICLLQSPLQTGPPTTLLGGGVQAWDLPEEPLRCSSIPSRWLQAKTSGSDGSWGSPSICRTPRNGRSTLTQTGLRILLKLLLQPGFLRLTLTVPCIGGQLVTRRRAGTLKTARHIDAPISTDVSPRG